MCFFGDVLMETTNLSGVLFANMIKGGAQNLSDNKQIVNELNVFPIPDGDTGDNMSMTIDSGFAALCNVDDATIEAIAASAAKGMLLGARGNSGDRHRRCIPFSAMKLSYA